VFNPDCKDTNWGKQKLALSPPFQGYGIETPDALVVAAALEALAHSRLRFLTEFCAAISLALQPRLPEDIRRSRHRG
jgi:hypothetical protein